MIDGCDVFIGLSGPGIIEADALGRMNDDAIVFAMANPTPEVMPEDAEPHVRIMATGRSDYPNQINNVLCFPGVFRGALDAGAARITEPMKLAAAKGIAEVVAAEDLSEDYIIPSVFDRDVAPAVAKAVTDEARREGIARVSEETGTFSTARVATEEGSMSRMRQEHLLQRALPPRRDACSQPARSATAWRSPAPAPARSWGWARCLMAVPPPSRDPGRGDAEALGDAIQGALGGSGHRQRRRRGDPGLPRDPAAILLVVLGVVLWRATRARRARRARSSSPSAR